MNNAGWRDIPGYGGIYQINSMGEVRSWKHGKWGGFAPVPKMMTPYTTKHKPQGSCKKWLMVKLTDENGKSKQIPVHILMRDTWMGGPRPGLVVYHKNGDVQDSCLNNLGFITKRALGKKFGGSASRRKPVVKLDRAGNIVECYPSARAAARANYISYQAVMDRCRGLVKQPFETTGGFTFAYED